jgi:putative addiction module component (TIGR02574 family)
MPMELRLDTLSVDEKVCLLETVWASLCSKPGDVRSPEWHSDVLAARKRRLDEGQATVSPWSEARARLLQVG